MYAEFGGSCPKQGETCSNALLTVQVVSSLAQDEARGLKQLAHGTEHSAAGLISEGEGVAASALETMGSWARPWRASVIDHR